MLEFDTSMDQLATIKVDRKSTRLNSSHVAISYAVFCLKKKTGQLPFSSNANYARLAGTINDDLRTPALDQSTTPASFANRTSLKPHRRHCDRLTPTLNT